MNIEHCKKQQLRLEENTWTVPAKQCTNFSKARKRSEVKVVNKHLVMKADIQKKVESKNENTDEMEVAPPHKLLTLFTLFIQFTLFTLLLLLSLLSLHPLLTLLKPLKL